MSAVLSLPERIDIPRHDLDELFRRFTIELRPRLLLVSRQEKLSACPECKCLLAHDERECRRCYHPRGVAAVHTRPKPTWPEEYFRARLRHCLPSNFPWCPFKRLSRAKEREEPARDRVTLTPEHEETAKKLLMEKYEGRSEPWEWINRAWLELVNPPKDIERPETIETAVKRAIDRAEKKSTRSRK